MQTRLLAFVCVVLWTVVPLAGQNRYASLEYDADLIPSSVFKARRDSLAAKIGKESVLLLYSAPVRNRNYDVDYRYRQDDHLLYLTGFPEPNAVLLLAPRGVSVPDPDDSTATKMVTEVLFVQERNERHERWEGRMYGPDGAMVLRGLASAMTLDKLESFLPRVMFGGVKNLYMPPFRSDLSGSIAQTLAPVRAMYERFGNRVELRDPTPTIAAMRAVKDPDEIRLLRKATSVSAAAHNEAMKSVEPGMYEYELQAVYEYVFTRMGAEYTGYPCIVGAGENTCILHYNTNRKQILSGELILADCGAEYHGYSTDITRTYPANGTFTKEQRQIYDIVLAAQKAAIAQMKPGASWQAIGAVAEEVVENGLHALGLVKEKDKREFRKFYWHGLGHAIGLNVHDVGSAVMKPGVVYTVEPGIYIPASIEGVPAGYHNIGVRIEDVVLITERGNEVLSAGSPTEPEQIEALMRKKGIGNQPLTP